MAPFLQLDYYNPAGNANQGFAVDGVPYFLDLAQSSLLFGLPGHPEAQARHLLPLVVHMADKRGPRRRGTLHLLD